MRMLIFILSLLLPQYLGAQKLLWERAIPTARLFDVDDINNCYIVFEDNSLVKYNEHGDSTTHYRSIQHGPIASITARNPLKILLFYPDFSKLIILDRMLSVKTEIDLRRSGMMRASAAALSQDGQIWVLDEQIMRLFKIDEQGKTIMQSEDIRTLTRSHTEIQAIQEQNRRIYLIDESLGLYIFDQFANFLHSVQLPEQHQAQALEQGILYQQQGKLQLYQEVNGQTRELPLTLEPDFITARVNKERLYILYPNKLVVYSLMP